MGCRSDRAAGVSSGLCWTNCEASISDFCDVQSLLHIEPGTRTFPFVIVLDRVVSWDLFGAKRSNAAEQRLERSSCVCEDAEGMAIDARTYIRRTSDLASVDRYGTAESTDVPLIYLIFISAICTADL